MVGRNDAAYLMFFVIGISSCFVLPCFATGCHVDHLKIATAATRPRNDTKMVGFRRKPTIFISEMFEIRRGATPPFLFSIHFPLSKRLRLDCGAVEPLPHMTTGTRRCRPPHDTRRRKAGNRRATVLLPVAASSYHKNRVLKRYSKKSSRIF